MSARIRLRRRVTSGNIKDPELHQERITDLQLRRQAFWSVTLIAIGAAVFLMVTMFL